MLVASQGGSYDTYFTIHDIETKVFLASPAWTLQQQGCAARLSRLPRSQKGIGKEPRAYGDLNQIDRISCPQYYTNSDQAMVYEVSFEILSTNHSLADETVCGHIVDLEQHANQGVEWGVTDFITFIRRYPN
jgi:hypothetical protein